MESDGSSEFDDFIIDYYIFRSNHPFGQIAAVWEGNESDEQQAPECSVAERRSA